MIYYDENAGKRLVSVFAADLYNMYWWHNVFLLLTTQQPMCLLLVCLFVSTVCVTRASISGVKNGSTVDANTVIRCTADSNAYPVASYRWMNATGLLSTGPELELKADTQYKLTCSASNDFDIPECYATAYVEVNSKLTLICFYWIFFCYVSCLYVLWRTQLLL